MPKHISKLTISELETIYSETYEAYYHALGAKDYKDMILLDALEAEIEKRELIWCGSELIER